MNARLDPLSYLRLPKLDVASALGLARRLLLSAPPSSPAIRNSTRALQAALDDLRTAWSRQIAPPRRKDLRPLARRLDVIWTAIRDRLATYDAFGDDDDDRTRARALHDMLFPDGLAFLKLAYIREHAESARRIDLIDARALAKDLHRLVGPRFLAALREIHAEYGEALGITKLVPEPEKAVAVAEPLRALCAAIRSHALQLVALATHLPEHHESIARALAPIDAIRNAASRRIAANDRNDGDADPPIADDDPLDLPLRRMGAA